MEHLCTNLKKSYIIKQKGKNEYRATIIDMIDKNSYFAEVVNAYEITLERRNIQEKEINKIIYNIKNN